MAKHEKRVSRYERDSHGRCWAIYTWLYDCPEKPEDYDPRGRRYEDEYGSAIMCQTCGCYGGHQTMFGRERVRVPEHDVELPPLPPLPGEQGRLI